MLTASARSEKNIGTCRKKVFKFSGRGEEENGTVEAGRQASQKTGQWRISRMAAWGKCRNHQQMERHWQRLEGTRYTQGARGGVGGDKTEKRIGRDPYWNLYSPPERILPSITGNHINPPPPRRPLQGLEGEGRSSSHCRRERGPTPQNSPYEMLSSSSLQKAKPYHSDLFSKWLRS